MKNLTSARQYGGGLGRQILIAALSMTTSLQVVGMGAAPAYAQAAELISIDIPAGDLGTALASFSRQTGISVSYLPGLVTDLKSAGASGRLMPREAVAQLLQGTGLDYSFSGNSLTLRGRSASRPQTNRDELVLDTLHLNARDPADEVYSAPRSSVYLSEEEIDRFGRLSPADMLRGVPGVQIGDGRNGGGVDVNIRGVQGQDRVAVTVDGARQALNVYRGYAGTQQRSYFDPELISDVVINKGPGSDAATAGAIGGSVQMRTLNADDILLPGKKFGLRLTGEIWDNGVAPRFRTPDGSDGSPLGVPPETDRGNIVNSQAQAASIAMAFAGRNWDVTGAYARRQQGNYFAGKHGREKYRQFHPEYDYELPSVAGAYMPGEEVLNSSSETKSVLLKGRYRPTDEHALEVSYRYFDGNYGEIMPSDIIRYGMTDLWQYPTGKMQISSGSANYRYAPAGSDLIDLTANLWWSEAESDQLNLAIGPREDEYVSDRYWARMQNLRIGADLSNRSKFSSNIGDFTLDLGGAFQYENIAPQDGVNISIHDRNSNRVLRDGFRTEFNLTSKLAYKPTEKLNLWAGLNYGAARTHDRNREATARTEDEYGRYILLSNEDDYGYLFWRPDENGEFTEATDPRRQDAIVFNDSNNPFEGVRYSEFGATQERVFAPSTTPVVQGFDYGERLSTEESGFAPSFGISYELGNDTLIYANYGYGIRFPSLFETSIGTLQVAPGLDLKPERSRNIELGASTTRRGLLSQGDKASFKMAYFDTKIKDHITRYYDASQGGRMQFQNADSFQSKGLELQSSYDNGRFFGDLSVTHYFSVETCDRAFAQRLRDTASRFQPTQDTPDCTPGSFAGSYTNTQNPPEYAVNMTVGTRLLDDRLTLGGRMTYSSGPTELLDKPWQTGATTSQVRYENVTVFDGFMAYAINEDSVFRASVNNITNRYYIDPLAQSFMPAPGRTIRASLALKF